MYELISTLVGVVALYAISQHFDLFFSATTSLVLALLGLVASIAKRINDSTNQPPTP